MHTFLTLITSTDTHGQGATLHLFRRLRGGGPGKPVERSIAPGGLIQQCVLKDLHPASAWHSERTMMFHVQILNSKLFCAVTGKTSPKSPISAKTYAQYSLPFYKIYEEKFTIEGRFGDIKSIKEIDKTKGKSATGNKGHKQNNEQNNLQADSQDDSQDVEQCVKRTYNNPIILLDPKEFPMKFRPVSESERQLSQVKAFNL